LRIQWTKAASNDLDSIEEYSWKDNPQTAIKQVLMVIDAVEQKIARTPQIGKRGRIPNTREFYITGTPYIAAYRITGDVIEVLRVIHGARRWPDEM